MSGVPSLLQMAAPVIGQVTPTTTTTTTGIQFPSVLLSAIVFAPFIAFMLIPFFPERTPEERSRVRLVALFAAGLSFFLAAFFGMLGQIGLAEGGGQTAANEENMHWLSFSFVSNFHLTADGLSLTLLLLTTLLFVCLFFHAWKVQQRVRLYVGLLLLLETSVNGVLCSADYILFLLFWGMQILPVYLLLRLWSAPERRAVANRYLAVSLTAFTLITTAVVLVIVKAGQQSSDIAQDYQTLLPAVETAGFWLSLAGFGLSLGIFPLHRWMVQATTESAAGVSAAISGIVLTLGAYGLMRVTMPDFPHATRQYSLLIVGLAVVGAAWGAVGALSQNDVRRFLAYTNLGQLSFVLLAVGGHTSIALEGATFLLVAHGLAIVLLTLVAGSIEERTRTRSIRALGGLLEQMPRLGALWMFGVLTIAGAPLLAGFVADLMLFTGAYPAHRIATVLAMATLVVSAAGLVWAAHRIFFGPPREAFARVRDATSLELTYLLPIVALVLLFGIRPGAVTPVITNGVLQITTRFTTG